MQHTVYSCFAEDVEKRLNQLAKKAERYGVPFSFSRGVEHPQTIRVYNYDYANLVQYVEAEYVVSAVDFDVDCDTLIRANGWKVIAHIEHGENGNIVTAIGDSDIDDAWYKIPARCDHCNTNRFRSVTFIVEHENGERRQVGKSCLKDYTGIAPSAALMFAEITNLFPDMNCDHDVWNERGLARMYDVQTILAHAFDSIKEKGYAKSDSQHSTKNAVIEKLEADSIPSEDGKKTAADMVVWLRNRDEHEEWDYVSSIERDCISLAKSGYAKVNHVGRLAYIPVAYGKWLDEKAKHEVEEAKKANCVSEYVGQIGERITFKATVASFITSWETMYGMTFLYKFEDGGGNVYVWFSSKAVDVHSGDTVKGTVKNHSERGGVKQTIITRCAIK